MGLMKADSVWQNGHPAHAPYAIAYWQARRLPHLPWQRKTLREVSTAGIDRKDLHEGCSWRRDDLREVSHVLDVPVETDPLTMDVPAAFIFSKSEDTLVTHFLKCAGILSADETAGSGMTS